MARAIVYAPKTAKRGDAVEIRAVIAHPMETGHRADGEGRLVPRNVINRVEARWDGELVFAADLYPAVAANPTVQFHAVALASGTLSLAWSGDNGFAHTESVTITVA